MVLGKIKLFINNKYYDILIDDKDFLYINYLDKDLRLIDISLSDYEWII